MICTDIQDGLPVRRNICLKFGHMLTHPWISNSTVPWSFYPLRRNMPRSLCLRLAIYTYNLLNFPSGALKPCSATMRCSGTIRRYGCKVSESGYIHSESYRQRPRTSEMKGEVEQKGRESKPEPGLKIINLQTYPSNYTRHLLRE